MELRRQDLLVFRWQFDFLVLENAKMFTAKYGEEEAQVYVMQLGEDMHCRFNKVLGEYQKLTADYLNYFGA